jgi:S-DNA-T family DNA segregation ATPase FtsK/SpoIIIE
VVVGLFLLAAVFIAPRFLLGRFIPWLREPVMPVGAVMPHLPLQQVQPAAPKNSAVFPQKKPSVIGMSGTPSPSSRKFGTFPETPYPSGPGLIPGWVPMTAKVEVPRPVKSEAVPEALTEEKAEATAEPVSAATKATAPASDLKQVAQEVWKKYGESPDLVVENGWKLPPVSLLDELPELELSEDDNMKRAAKIEEAFASYGVEAKVVQINVGPAVTQFGLEPGWDRRYREVKEKDKNGDTITRTEETARTRVKVDRITSLANDLALALAATSIRFEAPVPGKSMVGIEVPNTVTGIVSLRSVIESSNFQKLEAKSRLTIALGKGAGGEAVSADLTKMPHLLIAGATGSGKTVCLNAIICCILLHNTPDDVRFIMVDPKRVEMTPYNGIPHLAAPVIVDAEKAVGVLRWLSQEMDNRYKMMAFAGVRNIEGYNKNRTGADKMPFLVLVIDELADLMMAGFDEVEHNLCRLAQLARATGIHLVVATQRPSVDVITGLIKANFPTRISFAVTSSVDSRTILDSVGAEKLLGKGDMLYMPTDAAKPKRLQGCFVSDPETERLVYFWGKQKSPSTVSLNIDELGVPAPGQKNAAPSDPLYEKAKQLADDHNNISASYLQRQLHIGYNRAARLFEQLQQEGAGDLDTTETTGPNDPNQDGGAEVPKG